MHRDCETVRNIYFRVVGYHFTVSISICFILPCFAEYSAITIDWHTCVGVCMCDYRSVNNLFAFFGRYDSLAKYAFIGEYSGQITMLRLEQSGCNFVCTFKGHTGKSCLSSHYSFFFNILCLTFQVLFDHCVGFLDPSCCSAVHLTIRFSCGMLAAAKEPFTSSTDTSTS